MAKRKTNIQILRALVALADRDIVVQLFIMDALHKLANAASAADAKELETAFFSGTAWKQAAQRVQAALNVNEGE